MSGSCDCMKEGCEFCKPRKLSEYEQKKYDMETWNRFMGDRWKNPKEFLAFRRFNQNAEDCLMEYIEFQTRWGLMSVDASVEKALIRVVNAAENEEDDY